MLESVLHATALMVENESVTTSFVAAVKHFSVFDNLVCVRHDDSPYGPVPAPWNTHRDVKRRHGTVRCWVGLHVPLSTLSVMSKQKSRGK